MEDFKKQKENEQKYKQLRDQPREVYTGDYTSEHYIEKNNPAIQATQIQEKDTYTTNYKQDFDKASKDFWQKNAPGALQRYNGGSLTANFGKDDFSVEELLDRMARFVKESLSNELLEKKIQPEELSENFKAVEVSLKLLSKSLNKIDNNMSVIGMAAYLHGFINTYVDNIIRKIIDREKGNTTV